MKNYFDLTGQVALVTGASTGLAVQMAKALANQAATSPAWHARQEKSTKPAKMLADEYGVETLAVRCDVTDTDMVESRRQTGRGQVGTHRHPNQLRRHWCSGPPAEDITDAQFENEFDIDLFGTFKMLAPLRTRLCCPPAMAASSTSPPCTAW